MNVSIPNHCNSKYPIWAWVKCYNSICPPKRKGESVKGYDVKITFNKNEKDVFVTDEELMTYVRHDKYKNHRTDNEFLSICNIIRDSFDKCITFDSDILQGCVWKIDLEDVISIEFLNDDYRYGSLNYIRSNGERINWRNDFYKRLK